MTISVLLRKESPRLVSQYCIKYLVAESIAPTQASRLIRLFVSCRRDSWTKGKDCEQIGP